MRYIFGAAALICCVAIPAAAQAPLNVEFEVSASGGAHPIISARTNLPDGTSLIVSLQPPREPNAAERLAAGIPACSRSCLPFETSATVVDGGFTAGPFGPRETGLNPGVYQLEITSSLADLEPANVQAVIGDHGQWLMGPYAIELLSGIGKTVDYVSHVSVQ